jgi:hypothetical protein
MGTEEFIFSASSAFSAVKFFSEFVFIREIRVKMFSQLVRFSPVWPCSRGIIPNFSFPGAFFCGMMAPWANDEKRVNAQCNFCFSTT